MLKTTWQIFLVLLSSIVERVDSQGASLVVDVACVNRQGQCVSPPSDDCQRLSQNKECMTTKNKGDEKNMQLCTEEEFDKLKLFNCRYSAFISTLSQASDPQCTLRGDCMKKFRFMDARDMTLSKFKQKSCNLANEARECLRQNCSIADINKVVSVFCDATLLVSETCKTQMSLCIKSTEDSCTQIEKKKHCLTTSVGVDEHDSQLCSLEEYDKLKWYQCKYEEYVKVLEQVSNPTCQNSVGCLQEFLVMDKRDMTLDKLKDAGCKQAKAAKTCLRKSCSSKKGKEGGNVTEMAVNGFMSDCGGSEDVSASPIASLSPMLYLLAMMVSSVLLC